MTNPTSTARLVKCQVCRHTMRVEDADRAALYITIEVRVDLTTTITGYRLPCSACGVILTNAWGREIKGTVKTSKLCDTRCTMATSNLCTCECGGRNHGLDYRVAA